MSKNRKLINKLKENHSKLILNVYEKNVNATLFYIALGFVNTKIQVDEKTNEKEYIMVWKNEKENCEKM